MPSQIWNIVLLTGDSLRRTRKLYPSDEARRCFIVRSNGPFIYRDGEVEETRLVTPRQFALIRTEKQFLPDSLALVLPHLSSFRDAVVYDGSGISKDQ